MDLTKMSVEDLIAAAKHPGRWTDSHRAIDELARRLSETQAEITRLRSYLANRESEITRLRTELLEARQFKDSITAIVRELNKRETKVEWGLGGAYLGVMSVLTELAEAQAQNDHHKRAAIKAGDWAVELSDRLKEARAERDTLRQQLAVAREGLRLISADYSQPLVDDWDDGYCRGREAASEIARDTLAKLDQMGEKP